MRLVIFWNTFFLFTITWSCTAKKKTRQYFTGQIEYKYSYQSDSLNVDSLVQIRPVKSIFRYDTTNYQSQFIGKDTFTYYYSSRLNKEASKTNSIINEGCEDDRVATDSILSFKAYETDEKILGYSCMVLEYQSKIFHTKYYVSTDLKIAPSTYKKHVAYNWSFYGEKTNGGLILKLEHRFKNYIMSGIATNITKYENDFRALEIEDSVVRRICNK